jgi:hypothetical protein
VKLLNYPLLVFVVTFFLMWLAAWVAGRMGQRRVALVDEDVRRDYGVVQAATLTLLGLIIGFSFSMATGRYDLRKSEEKNEANAIGTEYVRADLLPAEEASRVKALLREYTALRIRFYTAPRWGDEGAIRAETDRVRGELWTAASATAVEQTSAMRALVVAGMNDVLNSEGYTQAAWWNRIPLGAWALMFAIALFCNALVGFGVHRWTPRLFLILPLVVAVAFFLISDIDSPRGGVILVRPQNLERLQAGLR